MNQTVEHPLQGRRVWITRPEHQSQSLSALVRAAGGEALVIPAIEITKKQISATERQLLEDLAEGDIAIFVSPNAAGFIGQVLKDPPSKFSGVTVLAVGSGTRDALLQEGIGAAISPDSGSGSEALLELGLLQEASVRGRNIVILRGAGGRELLRDTLLQRGANVGIVELYYRRKPQLSAAMIKNLWHQSPPGVIVITSGDGLKNLIDITPDQQLDVLFNTPLVVISDRVRDLALSSGFNLTPRVASNAGDSELMQTILSLYRGNTR